MQPAVLTASTRSELLATALRDTVAELRLIDAADLVAYIKAGQWANIADLVQSSAELSFEDGALTFACAGEAEMNWGDMPLLSLDMEFQYADVTAFFTLLLGGGDSRVAVKAIWFAVEPADEAEGTRLLADALTRARRVDSRP